MSSRENHFFFTVAEQTVNNGTSTGTLMKAAIGKCTGI